MNRRMFIGQLLCIASAGGGVSTSGCGSLLYSERIHRHHSRDIDWKVAALNGLGLAFFFVPGVIAFVVDFYTGAIYLPPQGHAMIPHRGSDAKLPPLVTASYTEATNVQLNQSERSNDWQAIVLPPESLEPAGIERVIRERTGVDTSLLDSQARVSMLSAPGQLAEHCRRHLSDSRFGQTAKEFFEILS